MGLNSDNISVLVGRELVGIDVEDGCVYFVVLDTRSETEIEYAIKPFFFESPDFIVDIEGDMADLIDTPILVAFYDRTQMSYIVESALGIVRFNADGPDTTFERV